jgi:hypothetical protein
MEQSLDDVYPDDRSWVSYPRLSFEPSSQCGIFAPTTTSKISLPNLYRGLFLQDYFELNPQVNDTDPSIVPIG